MTIPEEFSRFPDHWEVLPFSKAVKDATSGNVKVQKGDYLESGSIPIVDQGQSLYGGYTDEQSAICKSELPTIVFGDHTRTFKFIEERFVLGADGAKVLEPLENLDKRFLFHYLKQLRIESAGYSRHFKFLKETYVPVPPLAEQKRIAAILDKADALRRKRQQAIDLADQFLRSVFLDMFGDPVTNPKKFPVGTIRDMVESANYGTSAKASETVGKYPVLRMGNITYQGGWDFSDLKYIDLTEKELPKYLVYQGDLLFNRTNSRELVGKTAVYDQSEPMAFAGYLVRVRTNVKGNTHYLSGYLNSAHGKSVLVGMCKSIVGMANINAQELQDIKILIPPVELQNQYEQIVTALKERMANHHSSLKELNDLFASLSQGAFAGKL
ncbi:restriction endonuclease subunit S [Shewanella algae]|uniref:restriction endonuclease subunit S n=1 Tax=Shewanella algae TaxID=38313 RepID=UPI001AAD2D08|nr:restriction endonuclease subunit S [Shewanella algae]